MANKIDLRKTQILLMGSYPETMTSHIEILVSTEWLILAVDQNRGHCDYRNKEITVPIWAMRKGEIYIQWYFSHEMAHAMTGSGHNHDSVFMEWLKRICPPEAIGFETTYKPSLAVANGIGCFDF